MPECLSVAFQSGNRNRHPIDLIDQRFRRTFKSKRQSKAPHTNACRRNKDQALPRRKVCLINLLSVFRT